MQSHDQLNKNTMPRVTNALLAAALTTGAVVVNHLEALDHCPTTRAQVRALAQRGGWAHRLWVPEDGESRDYADSTVERNAMNSVATEA